MSIEGFHASDGWYFKRTLDGSVQIERWTFRTMNKAKPKRLEHYVVPENIWASIVCSVSEEGEDFDRWMAARRFHGFKVQP